MDKILESVVKDIKFQFKKDILVKPLDPIKVKKTITEQIPNGKKDEEGNNLYDVKETTKDIESDFEKGLVLATPDVCDLNISVGDTIVYPRKFAKEFDLYKTSKLVKPYDVVAVVAE